MPSVTTIITPLDPKSVETCRQYLRANADPSPDFAHNRLQCQSLFPFDKIKTLHFCSFVILEADGEFGPSLVFEATFDGGRAEFLQDLVRVAPDGLHELYHHCTGYPAAGMTAPGLVQEYFERHDVGVSTFFSGYPGRSVSQVQGEDGIHSGIVTFLGDRWRAAQNMPGRLVGFFEAIKHDFVRGRPENRWAGEQASLPWEVTSRNAVAGFAIAAAIALACALGWLCGRLLPGLRPWTLYAKITASIDSAGRQGATVVDAIASVLPFMADFIEALRPALPNLVGVTVIWAIVRIAELVLSGWTKDPRDQSFALRVPLQLAVILRYALILFMAGSALAVVISGMELRRPVNESTLMAFVSAIAALLGAGLVLLVLHYWAESLRLATQLRPWGGWRERLRRALLDIIQYATVLTCAIGLLLIARQTPVVLSHHLADEMRGLLSIGFVFLIYAVLGIAVAYAVGSLLFVVIRIKEWNDTRTFVDPVGLIARAQINTRKYTREEGGINTFQNHLASITHVKPGWMRWALVWLALWAVNLLARLWFNRGDLGGIPTIMSARWVLIDHGRRLLFLDNFGGAWESYLNEFIDLAAVKGLNAIWSNTFVAVDKQRFGFPGTNFLFFAGAQAEQPFKAYVRQSQIETLAWYSAYPMLSVVNVNANTDLRQSLSRDDLTPCEVDTVFQRL